MTSKPHDALFKSGFESPRQAEGVFRTLLPRAIIEAIDWGSLERIPGSFIDPGLRDHHTDRLFTARFRGRPVLLYLMLEHQSTVDHAMPLRMLIYMVRIWEQDLNELDDDALQSWVLASFPKLVLWVLRDARTMPSLLDSLPRWIDVLAELAETPGGMDALGVLVRYVFLVSERLLVTLLTAKFGELPRAGIERVELADDDQLDRYGRRLLTAETLDAVLDG